MIGMNWGIVGPIIAYLMMLLILSLQPYINARMVLFGVFVPEESRDHEKVRSLKKRFVITIWLVSIATAAIIMSISQVISAEITVSILILIVLQHVTTLIVMWIFRKMEFYDKQRLVFVPPADHNGMRRLRIHFMGFDTEYSRDPLWSGWNRQWVLK
jgi:hypothetical protein